MSKMEFIEMYPRHHLQGFMDHSMKSLIKNTFVQHSQITITQSIKWIISLQLQRIRKKRSSHDLFLTQCLFAEI